MTRHEPPPLNPADPTPDPEATSTPRPPAALADMLREIAADYDAKAQNIEAGDGAYGGRLVDELVATLSGLAEELDRYQDAPTPPAGYRPENPHPGVVVATARTAARSVVEYVADEGWFPIDGKTDVPDACADAVVQALTTAGLLTDQAAPGCPPYSGPGYAAPADSTRGA